MRKTFVCLANSKKLGERCIAGVEITGFGGGHYSIVRQNSQPKWIRPVSGREHGEVPLRLVGKVHLLDVVELEVTTELPQGYQSENILFDEQSLTVLGKIDLLRDNVSQFQYMERKPLFGNRGKAVHIDHITRLTNSLILIKPESVSFHWETDARDFPQLRSTFSFRDSRYDLPVTDGEFQSKYHKHPDEIARCSEFFFTISLGVKLGDFHYKLIAAVFCF
jgi:hypothetical protein